MCALVAGFQTCALPICAARVVRRAEEQLQGPYRGDALVPSEHGAGRGAALDGGAHGGPGIGGGVGGVGAAGPGHAGGEEAGAGVEVGQVLGVDVGAVLVPALEIGRASCRERVCQYVSISVVAVFLKKQKKL